MRLLAAASVMCVALAGCSTFTAPVPVSQSEACWKDVPSVEMARNPSGLTEYRTCLDAKSRGGSPYKLEAKLERVASKFCGRRGGYYKLISERKAFANFSNTSRVELVFVCTSDPAEATIAGKVRNNKRHVSNEKNKYELLQQAQKLYQSGALTQEEFLKEKERILGNGAGAPAPDQP